MTRPNAAAFHEHKTLATSKTHAHYVSIPMTSDSSQDFGHYTSHRCRLPRLVAAFAIALVMGFVVGWVAVPGSPTSNMNAVEVPEHSSFPSSVQELRSADADVSVDLPPAEEDTAAGAEEGTDEGPGAAGPPSDEAPSGAPGGDSGAEEEPSSPEDTAGVAPEEDAEAVEAAGGHGPGEDAEDAPIVLDEKMESYVDEALDRLEVEEVREAKRRNGVSVAARVSKAGMAVNDALPGGALGTGAVIVPTAVGFGLHLHVADVANFIKKAALGAWHLIRPAAGAEPAKPAKPAKPAPVARPTPDPVTPAAPAAQKKSETKHPGHMGPHEFWSHFFGFRKH